jgi:Rho termination factor, N-terminal domain
MASKAELESKHLAELHALAAKEGIEGYRMLPRAELIEKLADGDSEGGAGPKAEPRGDSGRRRGRERERRSRPPRQRERGEPRREGRTDRPAPQPEPQAEAAAPSERPRRKRRRRRWGRRRKDLRVQDLLLPASGRQAIVYAESREACTALLREVAAELSGASSGPDPIALLVDPSPDELADWKRDAPQVEIVAAGQARHAGDALAQATRRAEAGEDVIVLIDSLSRFAEAFKAVNEAKELFDAGQEVAGSGSLTVVAAVERSG